jgi:hypothetical protein
VGRKLVFWGTVAVVAVLANYGVEVLAPHNPGLARFAAKLHQGAH